MRKDSEEVVSLGTQRLGTIRITDKGFEVYGPEEAYVVTSRTIEAARKVLFEMHRNGERELAGR